MHEKFTVSQNYINLDTLWQMFLPHITDFKLASKSLSIKIKLDTSLTLEHPDPIANPTSANSKASISLIPSPVTETFLPIYLSPTSNVYLSFAVALANTLRFGATFSSNSDQLTRHYSLPEMPPQISLNCSPVIIEQFSTPKSSDVIIPALIATDFAVYR